ncbi:MAG: serine--tRNA ligase [Haloquadratum sp.]|jgi:seryl-tRNA synthetase (EC 6.1.1.11)|nr:serine--tRNA ligase [Haloferacaceae archaeon]MDR9444869.1 serine--tRNA ligase [Haloquadratum sp.]
MIDRRLLREDPDRVRVAMAQKGMADVDLDAVLELDGRWRAQKQEVDDLRHQRNTISREVGELKAAGEDAAAAAAIDRSQSVNAALDELEAETEALERELIEALMRIPQLPDPAVPVGEDESDNVQLRRWGFETIRSLPDPVIPHYDLGESLGILDFDRGAKVAGGGFYFTVGEGAMLEHALIQYMLNVHREQGYIDVFPPIPVRSTAMEGTGQFPKFTEDAYRLGGSNTDPYAPTDLWLCPTAEVPVTNMFREEILLADELPLKLQAYTPNFRREAGEHGTETRGIVRVHQFNKVELVNFTTPEDAPDRFDGLVAEAEAVLQGLELPYRILEMCTGDLGFTQRKKYDIEVWAPADEMADGPPEGGRWLEVSSVSHFGAYQARRAGLRYRPERHESAEYLHTLNGSGLAVPRIMVAILEYYQTSEGTVTVPPVLRPYMRGRHEITGGVHFGETAVGAGLRD